MIELYDTAERQVVPLKLRDPGKVSIYVCGPTVYGPPHIGHGRQVLVYDVLWRFLEWSGLDVTFVSNITDIDDAIIDRANAEDRAWDDIARKCEAVWWEGLDRIGVRRPTHAPRATEYVDQMIQLISDLIEADKAYVTSDGVYLAVESVDGYGMLPRLELENLLEGGGEREIVGEEKRHPADFVLWKLAKPGEPHWPSPWGDGRPGWHTECVVMSLDILGEGFDLHAGGPDLIFPHHENERAQAVALDRRFANHWMHHGFLETGGEKMSKSLGNVKNLLDLAEEYDPRAYRLLLLQAHYRSPVEVSGDTMTASEKALERLDAFARRVADLAGEPDAGVLDQFRSLMNADLDTPGAIDLLFTSVREANTALDGGDTDTAAALAAAVAEIAGAIGLELHGQAASAPPEIQQLAQQRAEARAARDFAAADELRDRIAAAGWTIEDSADGPVLLPQG
jgi:cysteinyl-tRNA synthetase